MNLWASIAGALRAGSKFLTRIQGLQINLSLPTFHRETTKSVDEQQQALFKGFKTGEITPKNAILGAISGILVDNYPIQIKESVRFKVLRPEIYSTFGPISRVFHEIGKVGVITSGNDSTHKEGSKHYLDLAIDLRSKHLLDSFQKQMVYKMLVEALGPHYLVLFESEGKDNEHFHVGYKG